MTQPDGQRPQPQKPKASALGIIAGIIAFVVAYYVAFHLGAWLHGSR